MKDRPEPYARVEWSHPRSGRHVVVTFPQKVTYSALNWFVAGLVVAGAIYSLAYVVWRVL